MNKNKKAKVRLNIKFYNILLGFFSITLIILIILVATREYRMYKSSNYAKNALEVFESILTESVESDSVTYENIDVKIGKYKIIGSIKIASIGLNYPILEITNKESLELAITKLYGPNLNELGNVSIAGHNFKNGTLFGRLPNVNIGDIVEITDLKNNTIKYEIYNMYSVNPDNVDPLKTTDETVREITLVTCTRGAKKRLIIKALEVTENNL